MDYWQLMSSDEQGDSIDAYWARIQKEGNQESDQAPPLTQRCMPDSTVLKSKGIEAGWSMGLAQLFRKHYNDIGRSLVYSNRTLTKNCVDEAIQNLVNKSQTDQAGLMVIDDKEMSQLTIELKDYLVDVDNHELADCLSKSTRLSTSSLSNLKDLENFKDLELTQNTYVIWFFTKCYENVTYPSKLRLLDAYYSVNKDREVDWQVFFSDFITTSNVSQIKHPDYETLSKDFILQWVNCTDESTKLCLRSLSTDSKIDLILTLGDNPRIQAIQGSILNGIESEYVEHVVKNKIPKINFHLSPRTALSITDNNVKQYIDFIDLDPDQGAGLYVASESKAKMMKDIISFIKHQHTIDDKNYLLSIIENKPNLLELFFTVTASRSYQHILSDLAACLGFPDENSLSIDLASAYPKFYYTYLLIKAQVHLDNDTSVITSNEYRYLNTHVRSLNASGDILSGIPDQINQAISGKQWRALSNLAYDELTNNDPASSCAEGIAFKNFKEVELSQPNSSDVTQNMIRQVGSIVQVIIAEMHSKKAPEDEMLAIESVMNRLKFSIQPTQVQSQCDELSSLIENMLWLQQGLLSKLFELLRRIIVYFNPSLRNRTFFAEPSYVRCPKQLKDICRLSVPQNSAGGGG